jgi:2-polyprenyl-3-methyl-5-hydroxy-6-metoxy-1,4-benzoquinol methylase
MKQNLGANNSTVFRCGACGGEQRSGNYQTREMMLGLRMPFQYAQCASCKSLWLVDPPSDFASYYADGYYSFASEDGVVAWIKSYLRRKRDLTYFGRGDLLGRFLARSHEESALLSISNLGVGSNTKFLDVGCGNGKLLHRMAAVGFKNLFGVDPYLSNEVTNNGRVLIRKCRVEDLAKEEYDVVMFHHSLEHLPNPAEALRAAARILRPGGKCLVRLPVVAFAWEQYKTMWVQLDPPRHMWVPTENAMRILANSAGLVMQRLEYDSTAFQFWGSELYARNIALSECHSDYVYPRSIFKRKQIRLWQVAAQRLNRDRQGDQAAFCLARP